MLPEPEGMSFWVVQLCMGHTADFEIENFRGVMEIAQPVLEKCEEAKESRISPVKKTGIIFPVEVFRFVTPCCGRIPTFQRSMLPLSSG
jgi:hypothetical protein